MPGLLTTMDQTNKSVDPTDIALKDSTNYKPWLNKTSENNTTVKKPHHIARYTLTTDDCIQFESDQATIFILLFDRTQSNQHFCLDVNNLK